MVQYLFIKYYATGYNFGLFLEEIQQRVETQLEQKFHAQEVEVYMEFLEVTAPAYYHDIAEVEHTFELGYEEKKAIAAKLRELVYFYDEDDPDIEEIADEVLSRRHHLAHVKFRKIELEEVILLDS